MRSLLPMPIMEPLSAGTDSSSEQQMAAPIGFLRTAGRANFCMVFPLPTQITEQQLAKQAPSSEPQTVERHGPVRSVGPENFFGPFLSQTQTTEQRSAKTVSFSGPQMADKPGSDSQAEPLTPLPVFPLPALILAPRLVFSVRLLKLLTEAAAGSLDQRR